MEETRLKYSKSAKEIPKFDPHKKISMSSEAPPPAVDYDVTYDPKIGKHLCNFPQIKFISVPFN